MSSRPLLYSRTNFILFIDLIFAKRCYASTERHENDIILSEIFLGELGRDTFSRLRGKKATAARKGMKKTR